MSSDRLTRQELSWLLAQQARTAAALLREGVKGLGAEKAPGEGEVTTTLDALDDAMKTLASLNTGGTGRSRRGRIDLAALLWELAPGATINLEPGSGTEVFGDESELRRMLQVLVSLGMTSAGAKAEASAPITVRREGDSIRVTVGLGPDSSVASPMEQAWLHRMAVRLGGKLLLEGGVMVLELPAGPDTDRREMDDLRRELAAAQEQGEAYARELATMFARGDSAPPPPMSQPMILAEAPSLPMVRLARAIAEQMRPELGAIARSLGGAGDEATIARVQAMLVWMDELARFGQLEAPERSVPRPLSELARDALAETSRRAERRGVRLLLKAPDTPVMVRPSSLETVLTLLAAHAVQVTPSGGAVQVELASAAEGVVVTIDDGGPSVPAASRSGLVSLETSGQSFGRPSTMGLFLAATVARRLGGLLRLQDAPGGGTRFQVIVPAA